MSNVLRTLVYDGQVSLTLVDTTEIVREGKKRHLLSPLSTYVFGKALSAMTFMSACLKGEKGEISLSLKCDGEAEEIAVSGNKALNMRGYINGTNLAGEANSMGEVAALGAEASVTIIRDDGYSRPFVGSCAAPTGEGLDAAFEEYYRISEQLPTRIETAVEFDENGEVIFAGVAALQPLPFANKETLKNVNALALREVLTDIKTKGIEEAATARFEKDEKVWEVRTARYKCNCSRRYLLRVLVSLGEEQLRSIIQEEGAARIHCHYCNTDYEFDEEDADHLFPRA
ncbi:MAG: Hsp33 family molecular chaperone HslO [Clostridia bacterium]|nr:Hsp33 family molecular chaperone HslO [Clostridia bacterium]